METTFKKYLFRNKGNHFPVKFLIPAFLLIAGTQDALSYKSLSIALQQSIEVSGTVTDASTGSPLLGVNIMLDDSSDGTISDQYGNFNIVVPSSSSILIFSHIGYTTHSEIVGSQTIINIALVPEAQEIGEVMSIGYGTIKKSDLTGAVSSIKQTEIEKAAPVDVLSAIQGRAAGVYVSQNSGAPGMEPVIRIRGVGTVNAHAPIYVIDGMIIDKSDVRDEASTINFLNPADITSIEVLKDASASAIYGSRGANGVVLITTHKGFDSRPQVTFNAQLGFAKIKELPENLGSVEYLAYVREAYANGNNTTMPDTLSYVAEVIEQYNKGYDTDWVNEVMKDGPAITQNYNLSIKGGSQTARYASSFGYYDENGILATNSRYKRYSFRINSDFNLGKIFRIGENLSITQNNILGPTDHDIFTVRGALRTSPIYPVYKDPSDPYFKDPGDPYYDYYKFAGAPVRNPVAQNYYHLNTNSNTLSIFGNVFAEASFLKDFTFRSSLGINLSNRKLDDFEPEYHVSQSINKSVSQVMKQSYWTNGWLWENILNYHKTLEKHLITFMAGYTSEYNKYDFISGTKQATPSNTEEMRVLDGAISTPSLNGAYNIITMLSMLGRINYSFDNRYLLSASIRRDGTSKFGPDHRWGVFPSVSLGWMISNESFFEGLKSKTIPSLKLRASWGQIGNSSMSAINSNTYISQFSSSPLLRALFNNQPETGYFFEVIGIPDLSWETTEQINVGVDLGLFRNALTIDADYFIKTTENMLVQTHVPMYAGYGIYNNPWVNAGTVENKGFEFLVNYKGNAGSFTYDISVNGSTYKNTVLSTNYDSTEIWVPDFPAITWIGYPVGSLYGYVTDGIFQSEDEVLRHVDSTGNVIQPEAVPGDFRVRDLDEDGEITNDDQGIIGNPHPKFIFGFTLNLGYRGFDIMTHWHGVLGNKLINGNKGRLNGDYNPERDVYLNSWREENPSNIHPRVTSHSKNYMSGWSDYFVEDASYLRMSHIQLGYNLPQQITERLRIRSCRIWIGGTDLLTFTKYSGNDPEVALSDPLGSGFDRGRFYPRSRKITAGINVDF